MNQASTPTLAAAVHDAGAFPSLWIREYNNGKIDTDYVHDVIEEFYKLVGHANVLIPVQLSDLRNQDLVSVFKKFKVSHMEVWGLLRHIDGQLLNFERLSQLPAVQDNIQQLKEFGKILIRIVEPMTESIIAQFDGVCIKGQESAGLTGTHAVKDLFNAQKNINSTLHLIPYGGIGTPEQVSDFINAGAAAVGIGTLFAVCKESPLSTEVKLQLIQSSVADISRDEKTGQNLVWLSGHASEDPDDWNKTAMLKQGMHGNGQEGLVYAGHGIQHVNSLRTVKETVEFLTSKIKK